MERKQGRLHTLLLRAPLVLNDLSAEVVKVEGGRNKRNNLVKLFAESANVFDPSEDVVLVLLRRPDTTIHSEKLR